MLDSAESQTFGALLRQHRLAAGLTQAALAERAGIAERTIQDLERGSARPRRATVGHLIAVLGLLPAARAELEAVSSAPRRRTRAVRGPDSYVSRDEATIPPARPSNLPIQPTAVLGRERELAEIRALVRGGVRLVTLTGPGGVGKTRLGIAVAAGLSADFADGVFLVELAPLTDPALVPSSIAQVLGVQSRDGRTLVEGLREYLRRRSLLLLLDNFEQVVAAGPVVADLLGWCPGLAMLVTSREPLRLRGECELAVEPLALVSRRSLPPLSVLVQNAAVALFAERAAAIRADFAITEENAAAIAEICTRLDGLPLAIELAAARIRLLTPQAMVERLELRLPLLTGGARDLPTRQQTLRATIDWSYDLLHEGERRLFRRLAVFVGGWTLTAAEAVCDGPLRDEERGANARAPASRRAAHPSILELLESLVAKSLIRRGDGGHGTPRFTMLETIREYALERLDESGEAARIRRRHAEYFQAVAERAGPALRGPEQRAWHDRLEAEHDNLRAALQLVIEAGEAELSLRLGGVLSHFWEVRGHHTEGRARLADVLQLAGARAHPRLWAKVHCDLGFLAADQGDYAGARVLHDEGLAVMRNLGDRRGIARCLTGLAWIAIYEGDHVTARALHAESVAIAREVGDRHGIARGLQGLGRIAAAQGDQAAAHTHHEECLAISRELGDVRNIARSVIALGWVAVDQQDHAGARERLAEGLAIADELGDTRMVIDGIELSAHLALALGRMDRAARLWGAAEAGRDAIGTPSSPTERAEDDVDIAAIRAALGELQLTAARCEGRSMSLEQAVDFALEQVNRI